MNYLPIQIIPARNNSMLLDKHLIEFVKVQATLPAPPNFPIWLFARFPVASPLCFVSGALFADWNHKA